jgi:hypothetical protein
MSQILVDKLSYDQLNTELIEAKNKIKELEERVKFLDSKKVSVESNLGLHSDYFESWKDCDGNEFSGAIFWKSDSSSSDEDESDEDMSQNDLAPANNAN